MSEPQEKPTPKAGRWRRAGKTALVTLAALVVLALGLVAAVRYGALVPQVRTMVEARAEGVKLGRIGRLEIEGLSGDIWRDLRIRRLAIRDENGVWLEANNVHLVWRYWELLRRRFDADLVEAESIRVLRRPAMGPKGKDRGLPVSFHIDEAHARLILEPTLSKTRGIYDVDAELHIERAGARRGDIQARSLVHPGDRLNVAFAFGGKTLRLVADAREARGGALAGALGLPPDRPFTLDIRADGTTSQGEFVARATTGDVSPLAARGTWNPKGGRASGRVLLTVSELTQPLVARLGEEVRFGLAGVEAENDLYALAGRLVSDGATARVWGRGDLGARRIGPRGINLELRTASLSRLVGDGEFGPAALTGALTGDVSALRFAGRLTLEDVTLGDYAVARVSGPVELRRTGRDLALETRISATGGRGSGYLGALLGGTPSLVLKAERPASGQLLVRDLQVRGSGLALDASGSRNLLGGVSVRGEARVSNLQAARIGASGGAVADLRAQQARAGAPWNISVDARGDRFALGFAELDRLLGPRPRVVGEGRWAAGRLEITKAELDGAALDATAAGAMARDGALNFKVDWNAAGPLRAGPVEITGQATGDGAVTGTLASPRLAMTAAFEEIDLPRLPLRDAKVALTFQRQRDGSSGDVAVTAQSQYGPARASADFRFPANGVDLTDVIVDAGGVDAQGSLALRRNTPSAADLTLAVSPGAFLDAGTVRGRLRIVDGAGAPRADLDLSAENARIAGSTLVVRNGSLTADGPLSRLPYTVDAAGASPQGAWRIEGRGTLAAQEQRGYELAFAGGGELGGRDLRTLEPAVLRFGGDSRSARLRLAGANGGRIDLDAMLRDGSADIDGRATGLDLDLVNPDLAGVVDATLSVQGRGERLSGSLNARLRDARGRGSPAAQGIDGTLRAQLTDATLTLDLDTANEQGLRASADVVLPVETSAQPFRVAIARQRPMRGRFSAEGEVRPLWDLAIGGERSLAGFIQTQGTISGSLAQPRASGTFSVDRGRFDDGATGLSLREVTLRAAFTEDAVNVSEARGVDGHGGSLAGQGRISLLRDGVSSFRLDLKGFRLIDNEMATASATGQATIRRDADGKAQISGDLLIDRADVAADPPVPSGVVTIDVKEINRPASLPARLPATTQRGEGWALDVKLRAPRRVFLRGRGLDLELSVDAHVGGTTSRPNLTGEARVVRGDYEFAGKRFEFDDRGVVHLSTRPEDIRLQLDATREDPTLTVTVRIRGTAARPDISLASSPSLPNDEILSQVLFGRSASQLSGVEAAQLAAALSSLSGGGGLDVIGNLRSFAGLDRLAFGGGEESGVTVSGGKYLTEDIYLEITGGGRDGPSAQVEWRVSKRISILSRLAGQAGNRIAVRWRQDY